MKQATLAEHQLALMVLARRSATKAVKARLKARGVNLSYVPVREIAALARDYLAEHRAFFVAEAKQAIWRGVLQARPWLTLREATPSRTPQSPGLRNESEMMVWGIGGARLRNVDLSYHGGGHALRVLTQ